MVDVDLDDREQLVSLDCGPLGEPLSEGVGCRYATLPARTLVKIVATVDVCCVGASDTALTNAATVRGTAIRDAVTTAIRR